MNSKTALLIERVHAMLEITPMDWDAPRTAEDYHAIISEAVYDIADFMDGYQCMHLAMTDLYRDLGDLRRIGEYMTQLPNVGVVESRRAVQDAMMAVMEQRDPLNLDMLATGRFADVLGRGMRHATDDSNELIQLGRQLFNIINIRTVVYRSGTKGSLSEQWPGAVDGLRDVPHAIEQIRNARATVLEYMGDNTSAEPVRQWHDALGHWDYIHNCPAFPQSAVRDHQRNAREWGMMSVRELTPDMFPYLDIYCAKLVLSHGRLLFRLNMLYHYHQLAAALVDYYRAMIESGDEYYVPGHPAHLDFAKIQNYLSGGY